MISAQITTLIQRWRQRSLFKGHWDPKDPKCWNALNEYKSDVSNINKASQ